MPNLLDSLGRRNAHYQRHRHADEAVRDAAVLVAEDLQVRDQRVLPAVDRSSAGRIDFFDFKSNLPSEVGEVRVGVELRRGGREVRWVGGVGGRCGAWEVGAWEIKSEGGVGEAVLARHEGEQ